MFRRRSVVAAPDFAPPTSGPDRVQSHQTRVPPFPVYGAVPRSRESDSGLGFGVGRNSTRCRCPETGEIRLERVGSIETSSFKRF